LAQSCKGTWHCSLTQRRNRSWFPPASR